MILVGDFWSTHLIPTKNHLLAVGYICYTWQFFVTFLGWWKRDPNQRLSDLQLGDQKVTLNHLGHSIWLYLCITGAVFWGLTCRFFSQRKLNHQDGGCLEVFHDWRLATRRHQSCFFLIFVARQPTSPPKRIYPPELRPYWSGLKKTHWFPLIRPY